MKITKMQGLGNDFILSEELPENPAAVARMLCRRALDIGADGLVLIQPSGKADIRMRIFNADGSEAEMCGNAIRCVARYAYDHGLVTRPEMTVETLAGIMKPQLIFSENELRVRVDMGRPDFDPEQIPALVEDPMSFDIPIEARGFEASAVLMGVPHVVIFQENLDETSLQRLGPQVSASRLFPRQANVNFVSVDGEDALYVRTWERGAGRTLACGTGACATAVVAHRSGRTGNNVRIRVEAGHLDIEVTDDAVFMTGPAAYVFTGETR